MGAYEGRWTDWLREQPPVWPRRAAHDPGGGAERWQREPEPFEDRGGFELYPGATVLEDLATIGDESGMLRILSRYTLIRLLVLSAAGRLHGPKLVTERRVVLEHLALLRSPDWERHAMERVALLCAETPTTDTLGATLVAAEAAAKRDHVMGSFALYRAVYEIARDRGWWEIAARAAGGIAQLARLQEAAVSNRVWEWRARGCTARRRRATLSATTAAEPAPQ